MVKSWLFVLSLTATTLSGCAPSESTPPSLEATLPPPPPTDEVVATVRGEDITMKELQAPLVEAHGLNILLELVQVDLAKQEAQKQSVVVTPQDIDDEADRTLLGFRRASEQANPDATEPSDQELTPAEHDRLLSLLLSSQHLTRAEFDLAMERNAYLRKLVAPGVEAELTDQAVHDRFNAIYGEKARVRFIRLSNMMEVAKVEEALKAGHTFDEESRLHSYDSIGRASSGELPPFSRKDINYPPEFKMVAFGLKPDQVSDPVQIKDSIYLVQLIELIPPRHAKFEDYQDSVKADLREQAYQLAIKTYLQNLGAVARSSMDIKDPVLKKQWDQNLHSADELRQKLADEKAVPATQSTAEPATQSTAAPATEPASAAGN
jgi:parvulin-like peptidyl-prolyl isomerase